MNAVLMIYLFGVWDGVLGGLHALVGVGLFGFIAFGFAYLIGVNEKVKWFLEFDFKRLKKFVVMYAVVLILNVLAPSKEILVAMMVANPVIDTVQKTAQVMDDHNVTSRLVNILDNSLAQLEKKVVQ